MAMAVSGTWHRRDVGLFLVVFFFLELSYPQAQLGLWQVTWDLSLCSVFATRNANTTGQTHVIWQLCNPATFQLGWWHLGLIGRLVVFQLSPGAEQAWCPHPSCEQQETAFLLGCWWNLGDSTSGRHGSLDTWRTYCIWYLHDTCVFLKNSPLLKNWQTQHSKYLGLGLQHFLIGDCVCCVWSHSFAKDRVVENGPGVGVALCRHAAQYSSQLRAFRHSGQKHRLT